MFLVVIVTFALSILGLFSQLIGFQNLNAHQSETAFADVMVTWHSASIYEAKSLSSSIFVNGGGCSLTPPQCQQVTQQQCGPVTSQECKPVTTQQCAPVTTTVCNPVTTQNCSVQQKCGPVTTQQCHQQCTFWIFCSTVCNPVTTTVCTSVNVCNPVTTTVCNPVTTNQCTNVTSTVCQNVTNTVCTPVSVTSCSVVSTAGTNSGLAACVGNTAGTSSSGSSTNYSLPPGYSSAYNFYSIAFQGAPFTGAAANNYILTYVGGAGYLSHTNTLLMRDGSDSGYTTGDLLNQLSREDKKDLAYGVVKLSGTQHVLSGHSKIIGEFSYNIPASVPIGSVALLSVVN